MIAMCGNTSEKIPYFDFAVVIPLYNKKKYIGRCLETALAALDTYEAFAKINCESYRRPEIIVIDDGSTDEGATVVKSRFLQDPRVKLHTQTNLGAAATRNAGSRLTSSKYIAFLDADDAWCIDHIIEMARLVIKHPKAVMIATSYYQVLADGCRRDPDFAHVPKKKAGLIERYFLSMAHGSMPICSSAVAVDRKTMFSAGGFPNGTTHGEDRVFWAEMAQHGQVAWSPRKTSIYHLNAENRSENTWKPEKATAYRAYLISLLVRQNLHPQLRKDISENISSETFYLAHNCILKGYTTFTQLLLQDLRKTGDYAAVISLEKCISKPQTSYSVIYPPNKERLAG